MKKIPLTGAGKGRFALVDDRDYPLVRGIKWHMKVNGRSEYARYNFWNKEEKRYGRITMHRLILRLTDPKVGVDHINGDGLDNRRENLRICSQAQNSYNRRRDHDAKNIYRGVRKSDQKWRADIGHNGRPEYIGVFETPELAAKAWDKKAIEYRGEFARLNFPNLVNPLPPL